MNAERTEVRSALKLSASLPPPFHPPQENEIPSKLILIIDLQKKSGLEQK